MSTWQASARLADPALLRTGAYVGGASLYDGAPGTFGAASPSTGEQLAELPALSPEQVRETIGAAHRALPGWRALAAKDRSKIIRRWFDLVTKRAEDLAAILTLEEGKPLAGARAEVAYAASLTEWFAEEAKRVRGDVFSALAASRRIIVPAAVITRKAAPALAAGCTMIVKPAEQTPVAGFALAELGERAGIPAGALNVVLGEPQEIGPELTGSPLVRKRTFTGSTEVGRILLEQSAATIKKVPMETGRQRPGDRARRCRPEDDPGRRPRHQVPQHRRVLHRRQPTLRASWHLRPLHEGTPKARCRAPRRRRLYQRSRPRTADRRRRVEKVTEHVNDAAAHGGELLTGGSPHRQGPLFLQPTVLTQAMLVAREETFGPITPLIRFTDEAEVIGWANDTEFGLISNEVAPFGGMKQSGIGREGSVYGIDEYLEISTWPGKAPASETPPRAAPGVKYQSAGKDHHGRLHEERVP